MRAHRLHHQYIYLSRRLLRDVYDQDQGGRTARTSGKVVIGPPGFALHVDRPGDQPENPYWLARYAESATSGQTVTLAECHAGKNGRYLRARLPLTWALLPVSGLKTSVAWMYAKYRDREAGRTLVSLCGSGDNYRGLAAADERESRRAAWYPSDAGGLMEVLRAVSEDRDDQAGDDFRAAGRTTDEVFSLADRLTALPPQHVIHADTVEVLAEIHLLTRNYRVTWYHDLDLAVLGSPLWIRTTDAHRFDRGEYDHAVETGIGGFGGPVRLPWHQRISARLGGKQ